MKVSVNPEGAVTLTGRVERRIRTLLHVVCPPVSVRDARRLEKLCNSGARQINDHQLHLSWGCSDVLEPYFCSETESTTGFRVFNGATILRVMNNRPPADLGDFAPILYERAEKRLRAEGKLSRPLNGFAALEVLFNAAIARELPSYFESWKGVRPFSDVDMAFLRITTRGWTTLQLPQVADDDAASDSHSASAEAVAGTHFQFLRDASGKPVQLGLPLEEGELMDRLLQRVRGLSDVCNQPLTHAGYAPREERTVPAKPMSQKAKKAARKRAEEIGYFVDFTGKHRPIPILHPATVEGLARIEGVLDPKKRLTKDDYLRLARAASDHRCKSGVGGPVIVPESAEFYVRLFRAIGLTEEEVGGLTAQELSSLTTLAARLRKLEAPPEWASAPLN